MEGNIQYGSKTIAYTLSFSRRKSLGITVDPETNVLVKAPEGATRERIESVLLKRAPWIIRQQSFFLSFYPKTPARRYISGETHLYLGRQYLLKVAQGKTNRIGFLGKYMMAEVKPKSTAKQVVENWYRERAKMKFAEIAAPIIQRFATYGVQPSGLYIQEMPTRWGSCTPKGRIILNPELLKAPKGCIEYVIIHELCHLVHRNHNAKFFDLQEKEMPDWEKWKSRLEKVLQ